MTTAIPATLNGHGRAVLAMAFSRIRRRYLRGVLGFAWFFLSPTAIFLLYWFVFGQAFHVTWRNPVSGQPIGYIAPFAVGYSLYLFLSEVVNGSASALRNSANLIKRGGLPMTLVVASFGVEFLVKLFVYLAIALALTLAMETPLSLAGVAAAAFFLFLFIVQAYSIGIALAVLTPFISDLSEVASLSLRAFVYAAGLSFPLSTYPAALASALMAAPLIGPLNGVRNAFLFGTPPEVSVIASWAVATLVMAALGGTVYGALRRRVLDVL